MSRVAFRDMFHDSWKTPRGIKQNLKDIKREVECFYERGMYGFSYRDAWSLDCYLGRWIPDALEHYRHAIPAPETFGLNWDNHKEAEDIWNNILDTIADGFSASEKMVNGKWETIEEYKQLEKKSKRGLKLFSKWYGSLWN